MSNLHDKKAMESLQYGVTRGMKPRQKLSFSLQKGIFGSKSIGIQYGHIMGSLSTMSARVPKQHRMIPWDDPCS